MTRRRYVQINGELVEVTPDYEAPRREVSTDAILWNDRSYQDMGDSRFRSRSQHREYMKAKGVTVASDFNNQWRTDEANRIKVRQGYDPSRKEDIARAITQVNSRRRK